MTIAASGSAPGAFFFADPPRRFVIKQLTAAIETIQSDAAPSNIDHLC
jgi:hypothetical protein